MIYESWPSIFSQQHHGKIRKTNFLKKNEKVIIQCNTDFDLPF